FGGLCNDFTTLCRTLDDVWEWDGADWHRALYATTPSIRTGAAMAYDDVHATAVMFGGQPNKLDQGFSLGPGMADTWLWDGSSWRLQLPAVSPPPRVLAAMAFDTARGRTVMFAGAGQSPLGFSLDDTWEWDGAAWTERHPATRPPPHVGHAMAYDAARDRTVMVGDILADGTLDQWQWDGTTWTSLAPASRPPGRFSTALAYDAERQKVVMFGGTGRPGLFGDTWEWDGTSWIDRSPASGPVPAPRVLHTLTYDPVRRRVVLFGGQAGTSSLNDVWEWDGTSWTTSLLVSPPLPREGHAMVYDAAHGDLVMFGGDDSFEFPGVFRDTWLLRYEDPARSREACDSGFDGDGDGKLGCEDPDCGALCARCGDAVCDAVESCRLCPGDCGTCHVCGDLQCDPGETCSSCPGDCGPCP
ncbi:MAG: kelch repeat-containing protein, partial [Kofleriaceae bacterium]